MLEAVELSLTDLGGVASEARLRITLLPNIRAHPVPVLLRDLRTVESDPAIEPVQLLEGSEYRYEVVGLSHPCTIEPRELFQPDSTLGTSGRIRTALYTGTVVVHVQTVTGADLTCAFEVRSRKLDYQSQYRFMLRDIASACTEVIMREFAPSHQQFEVDPATPFSTLYQQFVFLQAVLEQPTLEAALASIGSRPYVSWETSEEGRPAARGIRSSGNLSRGLAKGGHRSEWHGGPLPTLPATIEHRRTDSTTDNVPNQFIRFVLEYWRDSVLLLRDAVSQSEESPFKHRALTQIDQVYAELELHLASGLLRDVGTIAAFPHSNQVLMRREGYRDVMRIFLESQVAAHLSWAGGEDVYRAGQRDVATLYEYWVYLQFAEILVDLTGDPLLIRSLIERSANGLSLSLKQGSHRVVSGVIHRRGRRLKVELWYNRTFAKQSATAHSWSRPMRPDLSMFISPGAGEEAHFEPVWVHFDAKYRIQEITDIFGTEDELANEPSGTASSTAKRDDLLKMHSYRDAIRKTAGSFVIYPGASPLQFPEYHELLPGLGAFPLQPTESGDALGRGQVAAFLDEILDHIGTQTSQHERGRFWRHESYEGSTPPQVRHGAVTFLSKPPADTQVLVGFVKSPSHHAWIHQQSLYNVRADDRQGALPVSFLREGVALVLLYGPSLRTPELWTVPGPAMVMSEGDLRGLGYPQPRSMLYFCLQLGQRGPSAEVPILDRIDYENLRVVVDPMSVHGQPFRMRWSELVGSVGA